MSGLSPASKKDMKRRKTPAKLPSKLAPSIREMFSKGASSSTATPRHIQAVSTTTTTGGVDVWRPLTDKGGGVLQRAQSSIGPQVSVNKQNSYVLSGSAVLGVRQVNQGTKWRDSRAVPVSDDGAGVKDLGLTHNRRGGGPTQPTDTVGEGGGEKGGDEKDSKKKKTFGGEGGLVTGFAAKKQAWEAWSLRKKQSSVQQGKIMKRGGGISRGEGGIDTDDNSEPRTGDLDTVRDRK